MHALRHTVARVQGLEVARAVANHSFERLPLEARVQSTEVLDRSQVLVDIVS